MPIRAERSGSTATAGRMTRAECIPVHVRRPPGRTAGSTLPAPDGLVGCLRAADGQRLWTVNINRQFGGRGSDFGYACSPLVEDGKVILPVGGPSAAVVALDADSGETVWASGNAPASYCSAMPITFHGTRQVVAFLQERIGRFRFEDGRASLASSRIPAATTSTPPSPCTTSRICGRCSPSAPAPTSYMLEAAPRKNAHVPTSRSTGSSCCATIRKCPTTSPPASWSTAVFTVSTSMGAQTSPHRPSRGMFRCMDFKTGKTLWSSDRPGQATIAVADGKLLLFNDRGEVLLVRANPQGYEELARTEVFRGEMCWTALLESRPAVSFAVPTQAWRACTWGRRAGWTVASRRRQSRPRRLPKGRWLDLSWLVGARARVSL